LRLVRESYELQSIGKFISYVKNKIRGGMSIILYN